MYKAGLKLVPDQAKFKNLKITNIGRNLVIIHVLILKFILKLLKFDSFVFF